jgi:hypothetical protein
VKARRRREARPGDVNDRILVLVNEPIVRRSLPGSAQGRT